MGLEPSSSNSSGVLIPILNYRRVAHTGTSSNVRLWYYVVSLATFCCCPVAKWCPTLHNPMDYSMLGSVSFTFSKILLKFMFIESIMLSNHLLLSHPLLLSPSVFPSIRVFSSESALLIRWSKYWSVSISPSNEYSKLISSRTDWFDLPAVQGTLKSLLQHQKSKASILWQSAFFMVKFSHWYMTTGKTIALTIHTFVAKVMSLFFNMLSRFVIAFLSRCKCILI